MSQIDKHRDRIIKDPQVLRKYMLAGLFLTYRSFNHWGDSMTTNLDLSKFIDEFKESNHYLKLSVYKAKWNEDIESTRHYLKLIN